MFYFYSIEVMFRFVYIVISFIFCSVISFYNTNWLLLFIIYPFLKIFKKKFIITHVMDFLDIVWTTAYSISFLSILPFVAYQLLGFFKPSWYIYQIEILRTFIYWLFTTVSTIAILCYLIYLPNILNFFYWEKLEQNNLVLTIESEFRILDFIYWILNFQFSFIFIVSFYLSIVILSWALLRVNKIYFLMKWYRKQLVFISLIFLFILSPSEIFLQFFVILFIILFYELVFLFVCCKISNLY